MSSPQTRSQSNLLSQYTNTITNSYKLDYRKIESTSHEREEIEKARKLMTRRKPALSASVEKKKNAKAVEKTEDGFVKPQDKPLDKFFILSLSLYQSVTLSLSLSNSLFLCI